MDLAVIFLRFTDLWFESDKLREMCYLQDKRISYKSVNDVPPVIKIMHQESVLVRIQQL